MWSMIISRLFQCLASKNWLCLHCLLTYFDLGLCNKIINCDNFKSYNIKKDKFLTNLLISWSQGLWCHPLATTFYPIFSLLNLTNYQYLLKDLLIANIFLSTQQRLNLRKPPKIRLNRPKWTQIFFWSLYS